MFLTVLLAIPYVLYLPEYETVSSQNLKRVKHSFTFNDESASSHSLFYGKNTCN